MGVVVMSSADFCSSWDVRDNFMDEWKHHSRCYFYQQYYMQEHTHHLNGVLTWLDNAFWHCHTSGTKVHRVRLLSSVLGLSQRLPKVLRQPELGNRTLVNMCLLQPENTSGIESQTPQINFPYREVLKDTNYRWGLVGDYDVGCWEWRTWSLIVVCHSSFVDEDQYLGLPTEICDYFGGPDEMISGPPIQDSES